MANNISPTTGWSTIGVGATVGALFGYFSGKNNKAAMESRARIYEIEAEIARADAARDVQYYNEQAAIEGWSKIDERNSILSSQNLAMAASGFVSQSSGDKRLFTDTYAKYADAERVANRSLSLRSFERLREAELKGIELQSLAAQSRIQGKYQPLVGALNGTAQGAQSASMVLSVSNQFYSNRNNMQPRGSTIPTATDNPANPNFGDSVLQKNWSDLNPSILQQLRGA